MVDQKIELPNGDHLLFPADMPDADIQTAIEQEYPQFKASARSTLPTFDQAPPTAAELGVQFGPRGLSTPVTKAQDILVDRAYAEQQQPVQPEAPLPAPGIARAEEASRRNEARRNQQSTQDFQKQQALLQQFDAGAVHAPEDVLANAMDAASRVPNTPGVSATGPERYARDFAQGELSSTGSFFDYLGAKTGLTPLSDIGKSMDDYSARITPREQNIADHLASAFGSFASFYIPGLGVAKGAQLLSALPRLAQVGGAFTMAGLESAMEAGSVYDTSIQQGKTHQQALAAADKDFMLNLPVIWATDKLAFFNDFAGPLKQGLVAAGTNAAQEGYQQGVSNTLTSRPLTEGMGESMVLGGVVGGGAGAVQGALANQPAPKPLHDELADVLRGPQKTPEQPTPPSAPIQGTPSAPIKIATPEDVAVANQRTNAQPSEAQKAAGNYAKGHIRWNGLDISIENPAGSTRSGLNDDGTAWNVQMPNDYGYIKRTEGADGEQADIYLGPNVDSPTVFIIDQIDPTTGKFDEHKNMLGFDTAPEAIAAYQNGFSDGSGAARMGAITQVSLDDFKAWLKDGKTDKAVTYVNRQKARTKNVQPTEAAQTEVPQASISQTPAIANRNDVPLVYPPDESGGFGEPNGGNTTPPRGAMDTGAGARPTEDLSLDRRHTQQQPAEEHRQADRRTHSDERKKVSEMTHEELRYALLTDHLTEANNRRAYEEAPKLPIQASVDVDSLKWVNDNLGHAAGDQLLKTVAAALKAQTGETYHISGDEFIVQGRTVRAVNIALKAAQEALRSAKLEATNQAGNKTVMNGVGFSYGTGKTLAVAEEGLHAAKASRERAGHRAARGEIPPGVVTIQKEIQNAQTIRGNEGQVRQRRAQEQSRLQQGPEQSGGNLQQPTSRRASDQPARVQEAQKTQPPLALQGITNRPLASKGLVSYRYQGAYGPIMLGAENHTDALRNAQRSLSSGIADLSKLEIWNGTEYVPVQSIPPRITMADLAEGMGTHLARATDISAPSTFRKTSVPEMVQEAQARIAKIEREHPEPKVPTGLQSLHAPLEVLVRRVSPARSTLGRKIDLRPAITRTRDLMNGTRTPSAADVSWLNRHAKQYEQYEPQAAQALRDISATIKPLIAVQPKPAYTKTEQALVSEQVAKQPEAPYQVGKVAQTETPEFKRWFDGSKVVDAGGKPMVVYHASVHHVGDGLTSFDSGTHFGNKQQALDAQAETFARMKKEEAEYYSTSNKIPDDLELAQSVYPVYLSIKNPKRVKDAGVHWDRQITLAKREGYDGIVYQNIHEGDFKEDSYIAFKPAQIKSAIGNKGTFNPKNPNILEQNAENYAVSVPGQDLAVRPDPTNQDVYYVTAKLESVGTRALPTQIKTVEDAVLAFSYQPKYAVEHYDAIVTDAAGKPLAVIGSFKGAATQTSVFPSTVLQELALVPGAKTLWTAHNHPSGLAVFSEADRAMNRVFVDLLQGSGIDYRGLFAMTRKNQQVQFAFVDTSGNAIEEQITDFKEGGQTQTVPIQERMISGEPTDFGISGPSDAKRYIPQISKGNAGIVLLSAQHHPVAFIALSSEEVFPLRENDRFLKLVNKIAKTSAGAAFIVNPNDTLPERHLINLSASLAPLDIRALDVLNYKYDPDGGVRDAQSLTEKGWFTPPPFFLSKASQAALGEAGFGLQRQHQTTPYEALAHIQKTHPAWMPAITQVIKLGGEGKRGGLILNSQTANVYRAAELIAQKRGVSVESLVPSTFQQFSSELANGYSFSQGKESAHIITVKKTQDAIALAEKHGGNPSQNSDGSWTVSYVGGMPPDKIHNIPVAVENLGPASKDGWTQGFYSPELGISFINTDHLATHEVPGVLLHEVLHQTATDKETLALGKEVLKRIQTVQPGGKGDIYGRVKARMEQAGVAGDANEAANYLVEEAMSMGSRAGHSHLDHGFWAWAQKVLPRTALLTLKRWVAAVRAALYKHGVIVAVEDLKVDDISAIAVGNLSELAAGKRQAVSAISSAQFQQSVSSFTDKIKDSLETKAFEYVDEFGPLEKWQKTLGKVPADQDAQKAQQRYSGLVAARVGDFHDDMLNPFFEALHSSGIPYQEVEQYLYAKHALSRNAEMEKINPGQTALSGMSNEEAADILRQAEQSGHKPALEALAKQVYAITAKTRDNLVQGGLLAPEERAAWDAKYKNYVPLHRDEVQSTQPPLGKGFSIKGSESKRALGSEQTATNILAHTFAQHEASIIRAEKNKVSRALFELLSAHPDAKVGQVDSPDIKKVLDKSTGTVAFRVDPFYKNQPHVLSLKIDGEEHTVSFNMKEVPAQRMAYAFKNLGGRELGKATLLVGKFTRFLATMSTSANPVFLARNFIRDLQTAAVNLHDTPIKNKFKVFYNVPAAMRGFYAMSKDDLKSPWAKHAREFRDAGGQVGWLEQYKDIEDRAQHYKDLVHSMRPGALAASTRAMRLWWSFVEDANAAVENAVRLSAYATARDEGISEAEAAMIAKNLTVNFNIRGAKSVELNMWYMFAKASINGTARMFRAAKNPRVRKIMGGMVVVGFLLDALARGWAGDDDGDGENDYDQLSEYTKANNWVLWVAGQPVTIPQSYGLNFFPNIGRKVSQLLFQKGYHAPTAARNLLSIAMNAYSPLGTGGSLLQTVMPTIADPFIQLAENQNFASQPIYKKQMAFGPDEPEYQMGFKSASLMSQVITEWLNNNSRGNAARPGLINLNPSVMDFAVASIFGGAGKTYTQALSLPAKLAFDKEIEAREVPFANIFLGAKPQQQTQRKYYDALEQVQTVAAEYKDPAVVSEDWKKEHAGEIDLIGYSKRVEARLKKLNGWEKDLPALRNYPQQLNNLEAQIRAKFPQYTEALDKGIGKGERTDVIISIEEKILEEEKSKWMRDFNRKFYETVVK